MSWFDEIPLLPEIAVARGGARFDDVITESGGWCAPSLDAVSPITPEGIFGAQPFEPIPPCDGVNHRWERVGSFCHECHQAVPPRRLECEACDARLREDAEGLPAGHFDRLWRVAPC